MFVIQTMQEPFNPKEKKFYIPGHLFQRMLDATRICAVEMSMLGLLSRVEEGLLLEELYIPPQIVGESHAQINPEEMGAIQSELVRTGVITPGDTKHYLRFAWHSHVEMQALMSLPDRNTFANLGGNCTQWDPEWFVSMVMNRYGEHQVMFDLFQPIRQAIDITESIVIGNHLHAPSDLVHSIEQNVKRGKQTYLGGELIS